MKIENVTLQNFTQGVNIAKKESTSGTSFVDVLKESINKVGELEKQADKEVEKLATMENQDIHNTMIAIEKADMSFQVVMQVRNKIISAYEEVMRMQV